MFRGLLLLTFSRTLKSRLIYLYGITLLMWIGGVYVLSNSTFQVSANNVSLNGIGAITGIPSLGAVLIFLSVFGASRRIPEMMKPTLAGFYLSKPLSRTRLISYTMLSTAIAFSTVIFVALAIYGVLLHQWFPGHVSALEILAQISLEVLVFLMYVPLLSLLGLTTRSGSFAFLLTFAVWLVAEVLALEKMRGFLLLIDNSLITQIAKASYYMLPRGSDISSIVSVARTVGSSAIDWSAIWTSTLSATAVYFLTTLKFRRMDL